MFGFAVALVGLLVFLVGLGWMCSGVLGKYRKVWPRRLAQGFGMVVGGVLVFGLGGALLPQPTKTEQTTHETVKAAVPVTPAPVASKPPVQAVAERRFPAAERLLKLASEPDSWDDTPQPASQGRLTREAEVAGLGYVTLVTWKGHPGDWWMTVDEPAIQLDDLSLGADRQPLGQVSLAEHLRLTGGPLRGKYLTVLHYTDGSLRYDLTTEAYARTFDALVNTVLPQ